MSYLFRPLSIGSKNLKNRIVMPPMGTNLATEDGQVSESMIAYYEARSRGGAGMVIVEGGAIDYPLGAVIARHLRIDHDRFLPELEHLALVIKQHGAFAAMQIMHGGRSALTLAEKVRESTKGFQPVGPSAVPSPAGELSSAGIPPIELTQTEIANLTHRFADAARRAKQACFDGIEIHAGNAYLLAEFLSLAANKRADAYGRSLENRARFLVEVIRAVKEVVGPDFPVWCRINGAEYGIPNGINPEQAREIARMAQTAGAAAIHVTAWTLTECEKGPFPLLPGYMLPLAANVKQVVAVPVMAVGQIGPALAERALRQGKADLIAMGRALVADPELPNKLAARRNEDIVPCQVCMRCVDAIGRQETVRCTVNPTVGREHQFSITPADRPKRVLVIGAGPGGMEAARVASLRGHSVSLWDNSKRLGGAMLVGSVIDEEIEKLRTYFAVQMEKKRCVDLHLGRGLTPQLVEHINPDAIIVATGGTPAALPISKVEADNTIGAADIHALFSGRLGSTRFNRSLGWHLASAFLSLPHRPMLLRWLLKGPFPFGNRVVIIGGGIAGCTLAASLAERGKRVTIVEQSRRIGEGLSSLRRQYLLKRIDRRQGLVLTDVKIERIDSGKLHIATSNGKKETVRADTLVLALGVEANPQAFTALSGRIPEIYSVGDCTRPGTILEAIEAGAIAGRDI